MTIDDAQDEFHTAMNELREAIPQGPLTLREHLQAICQRTAVISSRTQSSCSLTAGARCTRSRRAFATAWRVVCESPKLHPNAAPT